MVDKQLSNLSIMQKQKAYMETIPTMNYNRSSASDWFHLIDNRYKLY